MRLPRLTTRRLMVAVAVVAILQRAETLRQQWTDRAQHFDAEAKEYWRKAWAAYNAQMELTRIRDEETSRVRPHYDGPIADARRLAESYERKAIIYQDAARRPWLPLPTLPLDPPPPE